jgi:type 1 fimbria pilin
MQTNRRAHVSAIAVLLPLMIAGLLAGCSLAGSAATGPLLTVELRGGHCIDGPCGSKVVLERDGRVHPDDPTAADLGTVPASQVAVIDAAIKATDFAILKSRPFTGECPVNFDGQEVVYEFSAPTGVERIESCTVEVDMGAPLFIAVSGALAEFVPLPVT